MKGSIVELTPIFVLLAFDVILLSKETMDKKVFLKLLCFFVQSCVNDFQMLIRPGKLILRFASQWRKDQMLYVLSAVFQPIFAL